MADDMWIVRFQGKPSLRVVRGRVTQIVMPAPILLDVRSAGPPRRRRHGRGLSRARHAKPALQDGSVVLIRALGAHLHPNLAMAAVGPVRQWQCNPPLLNGRVVEVVMNVSVDFTLAD
jgi:hypothetical protein